jgi:2-polyprenyl-3-methyl-5-hydroxy-6-metoxy-1,4-benzoquinol methylase
MPAASIKGADELGKSEAGSFPSLILLEVLENLSPEEGERILREAWRCVRENGRLIVAVPNENLYTHPNQVRRFKRSTLKEMLRPLGRPKVVTEQPLRWLVMYVTKRREPGGSKAPRSRQARIQVTARLCRGKVLELGCGTGALTGCISTKGLEVVGVDKNRTKIEQARLDHPHIRFVAADILDLPAGLGHFDTVLLPEILEHVRLEVGQQMLDVAWSLVTPEGRLIVTVPNEDCIPHPNHVQSFDRRFLGWLLKRFGKVHATSDQPYKWLIMFVEKN